MTYPKVMNLGSNGTEEILDDIVVIEEKLDGSNARLFNDDGTIRVGSHKKEISFDGDIPDAKLFIPFCTWVKENEDPLLKLIPNGYILFGEMMQNHNILKYENKHPIVLYDIAQVTEFGLSFREDKEVILNQVARACNVPVVKKLFTGKVENLEQLNSLLTTKSSLGGTNIEGIVIKNYTRMNKWGRHLFAKVVSQEFKEDHRDKWKTSNAISLEEKIVETYFNKARLRKAIQQLQEEGTYTGELKDIPKLLAIIPKDIMLEAEEDIKQMLWSKSWKIISRMICGRIPIAYKNFLAEQLFEEDKEC